MNAVKIHQHIADSVLIGGGASVSTGATLFGMAMRDVNEYLQGVSYIVAIASGLLAGVYTLVKIYEYIRQKRKARRR
jgi:hypothetical protein